VRPLRPKRLRIALLGFGHVGRRFAELLIGPYRRVLGDHGAAPVLTGIATARHGIAIDAKGLPLARCLAAVHGGTSLDRFHRGPAIRSALEFIRRVPADVLLEVTTLDPRRGQPATRHVRAGLRRGLHVVTANKGPVAFAWRELQALARRCGRQFRHEGAVMDGTPIFNLVERCLPGAEIRAFRGTLNSTTSLILARMESGLTGSAALREAQALGIAEADPSLDLDGWDATVKVCALANALWGGALRPSAVKRRGIRGVSSLEVRRAARGGARVRLVARAERQGRRVVASVGPERVPLDDPLAGGAQDAALVFTTDLAGEVGVLQRGGTVDQTAYALLSDLFALVPPGISATIGRKPGPKGRA
jgi:homoserine dehydrogenase